jgi:Carboxypeptidase regulatory-like domain
MKRKVRRRSAIHGAFLGEDRMKLKSIKEEIARIGQYGRTISGRWRTPAYLLALLVLITTAAFAQLTTADILGTVTDPSGAVVPNATIILTNLGTNEVRTTQSSNSGDYTFSLLPVGHYSVSVKAAGFQTSITKDLSVEAGDRARNDLQLEAAFYLQPLT